MKNLSRYISIIRGIDAYVRLGHSRECAEGIYLFTLYGWHRTKGQQTCTCKR